MSNDVESIIDNITKLIESPVISDERTIEKLLVSLWWSIKKRETTPLA